MPNGNPIYIHTTLQKDVEYLKDGFIEMKSDLQCVKENVSSIKETVSEHISVWRFIKSVPGMLIILLNLSLGVVTLIAILR